MKEYLKTRFSEATRLKDNGEFPAAADILTELSQCDPTSPAILAVLGDVYWDMNRLSEAISAFRRALELAPGLEAASLGLFHCLWETNSRDEALEEAKRFTAVSDSESYRNVIQEIIQKC